jgi:hypothetical protein
MPVIGLPGGSALTQRRLDHALEPNKLLSYLPARRASHVDPMEALRQQ